jgi:hypothetical protein
MVQNEAATQFKQRVSTYLANYKYSYSLIVVSALLSTAAVPVALLSVGKNQASTVASGSALACALFVLLLVAWIHSNTQFLMQFRVGHHLCGSGSERWPQTKEQFRDAIRSMPQAKIIGGGWSYTIKLSVRRRSASTRVG